MLLYSRTITSFIKKIKARSRVIMAQEMGLILKSSRFLWRGYHYPLHFVVFEDPKTLGYFDSSSYQIGLHKNLMLEASDEVIDNILRHELAHLYTFLLYQGEFAQLKPHGAEYRQVCEQMNWGSEISQAKIDLAHLANSSLEDENEKHLSRIKKLLSLAQSNNIHESQAATIKANELLVKYNLKNIKSSHLDEEVSCVKTVLIKKKSDAKLIALYDILQHFFVKPVISRKKDQTCLDVVGTRHNVELADYIAKFLHEELELFWQRARSKDKNLKGLAKKNSYISGLAQGFIQKLQNNQHQTEHSDYALISRQLEQLTKLAFPRLRSVAVQSGKACEHSKQTGRQDGQSLHIRPGVKHSGQILQIR